MRGLADWANVDNTDKVSQLSLSPPKPGTGSETSLTGFSPAGAPAPRQDPEIPQMEEFYQLLHHPLDVPFTNM